MYCREKSEKVGLKAVKTNLELEKEICGHNSEVGYISKIKIII